MKKRMIIMLVIVGVIFGGIFIYKGIMNLVIKRYIASQKQIIAVSTKKVGYDLWQPKLTATGTLRAIRGVDVTTEIAGMVQTIYMVPGSMAKKDDVLVQLNAEDEIAQLHSAEANAELARITYERDKSQFAVKAVSKQTVDTDFQNLKSLQAQVELQKAIVAKKSIIAPFDGRLGIVYVNLGQYINPGDRVSSLQTLDPIYADFNMPQQNLSKIAVGQVVNVSSDTFPNRTFSGKLTTINPAVDVATRNVLVEATIANPKMEIMPGMFVYVEVLVGEPHKYLTLPQTAISFNPYGDIVYVVREAKDDNGNAILTANQVFVKTGDTRGDQIAILSGLKEGDIVVTSGQLKLKNKSQISINNEVQPSDNPAPVVKDEY